MLVASFMLVMGTFKLAFASGIELAQIQAFNSTEGQFVSFRAHFDLPRSVENALTKGVVLTFVAQAKTYKARWYWSDERTAKARKVWHLSYQALTRRYRVSTESGQQNFDSLADALALIQSIQHWKIANKPVNDDSKQHYIELTYQLDTTELPRPFQIGIEDQPDWKLSTESVVVLRDPE